jgi:hypothetical protein
MFALKQHMNGNGFQYSLSQQRYHKLINKTAGHKKANLTVGFLLYYERL